MMVAVTVSPYAPADGTVPAGTAAAMVFVSVLVGWPVDRFMLPCQTRVPLVPSPHTLVLSTAGTEPR